MSGQTTVRGKGCKADSRKALKGMSRTQKHFCSCSERKQVHLRPGSQYVVHNPVKTQWQGTLQGWCQVDARSGREQMPPRCLPIEGPVSLVRFTSILQGTEKGTTGYFIILWIMLHLFCGKNHPSLRDHALPTFL